MNLLWTPDHTPPQLSPSTAGELRSTLGVEGAPEVIGDALSLLEKEDALSAFLDELGFELNQASAEGPWPARALNVGAAITLMAYRKTGVSAPITTEAIDTGHFLAELYGLPDAYVESTYHDPLLADVARVALSLPIFDESYANEHAKGGYDQVGLMGAGCTRHYLQQALELAA